MGTSFFWFLSIVLMPPAQSQCLFAHGPAAVTDGRVLAANLVDCNNGMQGLFGMFWVR